MPRVFPGLPQGASRLYSVREDAVVKNLARAQAPQAASAIRVAERLLRHEFDMLGSGPFVPKDPDRPARAHGYMPIDWTLDPVRNLRFPNHVPFKEWRLYEMRPGLADIKHPWELARCQHFAVLTQAFRLTGRREFAAEVLDEIADFMEANPEGRGIQWTCTMDVALRAASWAMALEDLRIAGYEHPSMEAAYEALFHHGHFVFENLENHYEVTSNHFLSNVVGLLFVALVFEGDSAAKTWAEFCVSSLEKEIEVQVLPDGADYESSVPYHRLVAELFLAGARLAECGGTPLSAGYRGRLESMIDFMAGCLRPDGLMPIIGDADDGRVHIFSGYGKDDPRDPSHLFGPAAAMFGREDWRAHAGPAEAWECAFWGYDIKGPAPHKPRARPPGARLFKDAGVAVLETATEWLLVTNGETGTRGFGNHKHNDLLSFEFHAEGGPWIVDPGSYVYTGDPDARNLHRGTSFHSTLQLGDLEQGEMRADWLFRILSLSHPEHLECRAEAGVLKYRGLHRGYARNAFGAVHTRSFTLHEDRGRLTIDDHIEGAFHGRATFSFHLDPGVSADVVDGGAVRLRRGASSRMLRSCEGLPASLDPGYVSPSYGRREPSTLVRFATTISAKDAPRFQFVLEMADPVRAA
jgi:uncharacterized heparinase superfamily protein